MSLTNLTAAQLSQLAYLNFATVTGASYTDGSNAALPSGWQVDATNSSVSTDGNNQFITFVNSTTNEVVMVFKGSDNLSNYESDILDAGASAWSTLSADATTALANIQSTYPGATIVTDGHSLGGGMAQTFALENNLDG